jgi:transcriptional regulator with XRE-family HTH domain
MEFRKIFCELRLANEMSQEEVAEKLNVSRQTISKWENGAANPDMYNLQAISALFGVSIDYLVTGKKYIDDDRDSGSFAVTFKNLLRQENHDDLKKLVREQGGAALIMWALLCMVGWSIVNIIITQILSIGWVMIDALYIICLGVMLLALVIQTVYYLRKKRNTILCRLSWLLLAVNLAIIGLYIILAGSAGDAVASVIEYFIGG